VIAETVLLIAVAWALQRCVPKSDWLEPPRSWRQNLPVIVFVLIWLSGAYGITLFVVGGWEDFFDLTRSPGAWIESRLYLPLAYTLLLALVHGLADLRHYRQRVARSFRKSGMTRWHAISRSSSVAFRS
jgi:hypothetical protein